MTYAVLEAYHTYAPKGRFPPAILFLEMDPEQVDVNVHPAKREIRFRDESRVRTFLMESLLNRNKELSSRIEFSAAQMNLEKDGDSGRLVPQIDPTAMDIFKKERGQDSKSAPIPDLFSGGEIEANQKEKEKSSSNESQTGLKRVGPRDASTGIWRFLDQSHGDLAIFSTPDGVLFFHARAAYDRVLYEQLEDAFQDSNKSDSQALLFPESLELDGIDQKNLVDSLDHLRSVGFELEEFGRNFFRVEGCPQWVDPEKALQFLKDFLEIARESGGTMNPEKFSKEVLVSRATHDQSNRKGFSDQEIIRLAEQLLTCRNPFSCPKGKPTFYEIPKREMEERFKRNL
tara:strand:+ start:34 stop:1065 length:1032 start_codon:yes stop_codon:yes gene_type:complete